MAAELTDIETARELVLERARPLVAEPVPLAEARGRTLAEPVSASERVPGFDNSAMDGFAVRSSDVAAAGREDAVRLRLVAESRAGAPSSRGIGPGETISISTGAKLPEGADAVVRVEDTRGEEGSVAIAASVEPGQNVRRAGEDIEPGAELLGAGARLSAAELGVLASVGVATPACRRRPTVALVSTGDELIGAGDPLRAGAVRNSNSHALAALARDCGAEPLAPMTVGDQPEATREAVRSGLEADALVVCGGISVGEHDHVRAAFGELGVEEVFWRLSLKPGKPAYFGTGPHGLVFGLPGNPVSAFVTFILLVRPALLAQQGAEPSRTRLRAELSERYRKPADRAHAIRCRLERGPGGWLATAAPRQGSHVMTSLLGADGLALIPEETTVVEAGEPVTVELLEPAA